MSLNGLVRNLASRGSVRLAVFASPSFRTGVTRGLPYVLIFFAAVIAMSSWYRGQMLVWGIDANMPLTIENIGEYFRITDAALASPDVRKLPFILPLGALLWAWGKLGIPYDPAILQRFLLLGLLAASGISMYVLIRTFLYRLGKIPALGAALFYMFNLYTLTTIWSPMSNLLFHYSLLPLVLTVWLYAFRRDSIPIGLLAAIVWSLSLTPSYITTPVALTDFLLLTSIAVVHVLRSHDARGRWRALSLFGIILTVWLGLSAYWIVPTLYFFGTESTRGLATGNPNELFTLNSPPLTQAIRLGGYWGLTSGYKGSPYFPWAPFYGGLAGALGFLLPLLAIGGLIRQPKKNARYCPSCGNSAGASTTRTTFVRCKSCGASYSVRLRMDDTTAYLWFFAGLLIISLILITGPNQPLGNVKQWVLTRFDLLGPFRSVYQRFGVYASLAYAPLIAAGLGSINSLVSRVIPGRHRHFVSRGVAGGFIVLLGVVLAWPMWTGAVFNRSGIIPSRRIDIPSDYERVARWIDQQDGDFVVLTLPHGPSAVMALSWSEGEDGYLGVEPLKLLSTKPFLLGDPSTSYLDSLVVQASRGGPRAWPALRFLNVRYVVVHVDANREYLEGLPDWTGVDLQEIQSGISRTPELILAMRTTNLDVYEVRRWVPMRLFAVRNYHGESIYASKFGEVRPVQYLVLGPGRFFLPAAELKQHEILVLNYPFDSLWRIGHQRPVRIAPGLTGFRVGHGEPISVEHELEGGFHLLLALIPTVLLTSLGTAAFLIRKHRNQARHEAEGGDIQRVRALR